MGGERRAGVRARAWCAENLRARRGASARAHGGVQHPCPLPSPSHRRCHRRHPPPYRHRCTCRHRLHRRQLHACTAAASTAWKGRRRGSRGAPAAALPLTPPPPGRTLGAPACPRPRRAGRRARRWRRPRGKGAHRSSVSRRAARGTPRRCHAAPQAATAGWRAAAARRIHRNGEAVRARQEGAAQRSMTSAASRTGEVAVGGWCGACGACGGCTKRRVNSGRMPAAQLTPEDSACSRGRTAAPAESGTAPASALVRRGSHGIQHQQRGAQEVHRALALKVLVARGQGGGPYGSGCPHCRQAPSSLKR